MRIFTMWTEKQSRTGAKSEKKPAGTVRAFAAGEELNGISLCPADCAVDPAVSMRRIDVPPRL
jgi:hypothetical protein